MSYVSSYHHCVFSTKKRRPSFPHSCAVPLARSHLQIPTIGCLFWTMPLRITAHPGFHARLTIQQIGGNQLRLSSFGTPNQPYTLQFTDLRSSWQTLTNVAPDLSGTLDLTPTAAPGFYRWSYS